MSITTLDEHERYDKPGGTSKYHNRDGSKVGYVLGWFDTFNEAKDACVQHANREAEAKGGARDVPLVEREQDEVPLSLSHVAGDGREGNKGGNRR